MKSRVKRLLSMALVVCFCISMLPFVALQTEAASNIVMNGVNIGYSDGSYFTKNGKSCANTYWKSGRCHKNGVCDEATHSECNCMRYWPTGDPSTCQVNLLGSQCLAFARYCQWKVYGSFATKVSSSYSDLTGEISKSNCTATNLKNKLLNCAPATHIRMPSPHSISIISTSDSGITFADCNSDGYCKVRVFTYTWSSFATYVQGKGGITYAYSRNGVNPTPIDCACSATYAGQYICTTSSLNLTIRSGHGSTYSAIGSIPPGGTVTVTKASGTNSSDWAHVTYNGISGYVSMQYLKKQGTQHAEYPTIHWWISDSAYGSSDVEKKAGNRYYLCYELVDKVTGKNWDEVSSNSYTVTIGFYNPDGSELFSSSSNTDSYWISCFFSKPGTYTMKFSVTGDFSGSNSSSFTILDNPKKIYSSHSSINLTLGATETATLKAWSEGYYDGNTVFSWKLSNNIISCSWGDWQDDGSIPLYITANSLGSTSLTLMIKDKNTGSILHSTVVNISVDAKTYTVSYNANGGSGAPGNQTKYHNTSLTLSTTKPTRSGYTFLGWATSSTATSATYQPGGSFTGNTNATLYAVWKVNPTSLNPNSTNSAVISTGGEMKFFTYTPTTSGKYVIYSTGSDDTKVYLYNASGTELDSDDDDGDANNFRLEYNLTAGTTYTFGIRYYNSAKTGTILFKFGNVYSVAYNANGGSGAPLSQSKDYGTDLILSTTKPTRSGYTFLGWATSSTATSATYQPGDSFTGNTNATLYAVWKQGCENNSHGYSYKVSTTPTISSTGALIGYCSKCSSTTTVSLPRLSSSYYSYSITKVATCTTTGIGRYTWKTTTYGSFYFDVTLSATDHLYSQKITAPTCTAQGFTTYTCHCGYSYVCDYIEALSHSYGNWAVTTAPSCTEAGVETRTCACGETETRGISAAGHTEIDDAYVSPTCVNTGLTEGKHCSACDTVIVAQDTVPALGHDFAETFTVDVEPTIESLGQKSRHCTRCNEVTDVTEIPKLPSSIDSSAIFTDVKPKSWFKSAVDYVVTNELMNGMTADKFEPNTPMSRAMLVTVLWRLEGSPVPVGRHPFTDLKQAWYKDAVNWAYQNDIVNGTSADKFSPNGNITREQMAAILYRYSEYKGKDISARADISSYPDAGRVHDYALEAIAWANAEGLITGTAENGVTILAPRASATRAQVATILMRFCEKN